MGLPNPPKLYGSNCSLCFPAGETPRFLSITFSGIEALEGYPLPNGSYTCEQVADSPCQYFGEVVHEGLGFQCFVYFSEPFASVTLLSQWFYYVFDTSTDSPCSLSGNNNAQEPEMSTWWGGSCSGSSFFPSTMNYTGGFFPVPEAKIELYNDTLEHVTIRTCEKSSETEFLIKVKKSEIPP